MIPAPLPARRFVELVRVSSQGQAARDTPEVQRAKLDAWRATHTADLFVERIDETISATLDSVDRSDLRRLEALAKARAFDEIRVYRMDRLTRHPDVVERFVVFGILKKAGAVIVEVESGTMTDPATDSGEVNFYFKTKASSDEARTLLVRTQDGKKRAASEGRLAQGKAPFGRTYDARTGAWGVNAADAATVVRVYEEAIAGRTQVEIAEGLNRDKIASPRGAEWTRGSVAHLLRDASTAGAYVTQGRTIQLAPIVDRATFEAARRALRARVAVGGGPAGSVFALLRKIAICGTCRRLLTVRSTCKGRRYYVCPACRCSHPLAKTDERAIERLRAWCADPAQLLAAAGLDGRGDAQRDAETEIVEAEEELRDLRKRTERLARLTSKGLLPEDEGERQLTEVAKQRADAEGRRSAARLRLRAVERAGETARAVVDRVEELRGWNGEKTPEEWRELCNLAAGKGGAVIHPNGQIDLFLGIPALCGDLTDGDPVPFSGRSRGVADTQKQRDQALAIRLIVPAPGSRAVNLKHRVR